MGQKHVNCRSQPTRLLKHYGLRLRVVMQAASSPVRKKTKKRQSIRLREGNSANDTLQQLQRWNASMQFSPRSSGIAQAPLDSTARQLEGTNQLPQQDARDQMLAYARQAI